MQTCKCTAVAAQVLHDRCLGWCYTLGSVQCSLAASECACVFALVAFALVAAAVVALPLVERTENTACRHGELTSRSRPEELQRFAC